MKPSGQIGRHLESMVTLFREESLKKHFVVHFVPQKSLLDNIETSYELFSFTMLLLRFNPNISRCFYFVFSLQDGAQAKQLTDSVQKNKGTRTKTPTPSATQ